MRYTRWAANGAHARVAALAWCSRASPSQWVGPKRFQPVPVALKELPPLDAVVITHDHYDHLDHSTIRALARTNSPFVTSLGVGAYLEAWGVPAARIRELDCWESYTLPKLGLTITAAPSQHFSGRGLRDRNATLWSSVEPKQIDRVLPWWRSVEKAPHIVKTPAEHRGPRLPKRLPWPFH